MSCPRSTVLAQTNQPMPFVCFLDKGAASMVTRSPEGQVAEAGLIGREGFVLPAVVLGTASVPNVVQMQLPGSGWRIARARLLTAFDRSATLRSIPLRFTQVFLVQATCTSLANAVYQVDERLARWLLMCHDGLDSGDILITHEFMSIMPSVRRPSVTNALHALEGNGFIKSERGCVPICNRAAMEEFAADAYG